MGKMFQTVCSDADVQSINPTARKRNMYGYLKKMKMNLPASLKTSVQKMELSVPDLMTNDLDKPELKSRKKPNLNCLHNNCTPEGGVTKKCCSG